MMQATERSQQDSKVQPAAEKPATHSANGRLASVWIVSEKSCYRYTKWSQLADW